MAQEVKNNGAKKELQIRTQKTFKKMPETPEEIE